MMTVMATFHISENEAMSEFASLLARVRAGEQIVIESDGAPIAVLSPAMDPPVRLLSESIRMAREQGRPTTVDGGFTADVEAGIASHREPLDNPWDL